MLLLYVAVIYCFLALVAERSYVRQQERRETDSYQWLYVYTILTIYIYIYIYMTEQSARVKKLNKKNLVLDILKAIFKKAI